MVKCQPSRFDLKRDRHLKLCKCTVTTKEAQRVYALIQFLQYAGSRVIAICKFTGTRARCVYAEHRFPPPRQDS